MKECTACGREFQDDVQFCPIDGQPLEARSSEGGRTAPVKDPFVGTVLDDKYRLDKKIGEGGMGAVYRSTHIHMDSAFAVKLLHKNMVADQQAVERFRREARAAARIRHANAVSVTDFGVTKEGTVYLVMEYLEGGDLRDRIKRDKVLSPEDTTRIMVQTCAAIEEAHKKGIVHRDLKPDNIWLLKREDTDEEQVKVLDFGIAKLKTQGQGASNLTQQGMIVGTPHYMSPEQCRGEELDARSDLYSLGVILYEMLTGNVPFRAPTPVGVVLKHANELPKPLREVNPSVPEPIERVVMKALEKDRETRQHSAAELSRELVDALQQSGGTLGDFAGYASFDNLGRVPSGTQTGPQASSQTGERTGGSRTAPQTGHGTAMQDPHRTGAVGGGATVVMTSNQPAAAAQKTGAGAAQDGGTVVMASQTDPTSGAPVISGPRLGEITTTEPTSNAKMYAIVGGVVVLLLVGVIAVVALMMSGPSTNTNSNASTGNTNTDAPPGIPPPPPGMVYIKGGTFMMGTDEADADDVDKPAHEVTVDDFYIDQFEVTNEEYQQFVRSTGYTPPPNWKGADFPPGEGKFPVTMVSWFDAKKYAEWAGKRLPTESEWEYAARGADGRAYPWGTTWNPQLSNSVEDNRQRPMAVGSYPRGRSPFNVYDMAGNVAEWVADDFKLYEGSKATPEEGFKSYRGGAFSATKERLKATYRWYDSPEKQWPYLGFRCAKDLPKQ